MQRWQHSNLCFAFMKGNFSGLHALLEVQRTGDSKAGEDIS